MSYSVDLHPDLARPSENTIRTESASHPSDYECTSGDALGYCRLAVVENRDVTVFRLANHPVLDELTVTTISTKLLRVADRSTCHRPLLDVSGVARLSSAMLPKLVTLHRNTDPKGKKLQLCGVNTEIQFVVHSGEYPTAVRRVLRIQCRSSGNLMGGHRWGKGCKDETHVANRR